MEVRFLPLQPETENVGRTLKYSHYNFQLQQKLKEVIYVPAKINLLNQRFGKLTVLEETPERKNKSVVWKCKCDCGEEVFLSTKELRSDGITQCKSCGTDRQPRSGRRDDLTGQIFGRLTVLSPTEQRRDGCIIYQCQCECGKTVLVCSRELKNGDTQSCGCIKLKYRAGDIVNNREIIKPVGSKNNNFYYRCRCLLCGREYEALTATIDKTISCGCQRSIGEFNIVQILNSNNILFQKEFQFPNSLYRFDFAIFDDNGDVVRLIEFDGEQHYESQIKNSGWNTYQKYEYTYRNDMIKNNLAKSKNIPLVRIPYWEREVLSLEMLMGDQYLIS